MSVEVDIVSKRYEGILSKKNKHLRIFDKVRNKLKETLAEMDLEISKSGASVEEMKTQIAVEETSMVYLNTEKEKTAQTIEKINALLG